MSYKTSFQKKLELTYGGDGARAILCNESMPSPLIWKPVEQGYYKSPKAIEEERQEAQAAKLLEQERQKALAPNVDIFDLTTYDVMSVQDAYGMKEAVVGLDVDDDDEALFESEPFESLKPSPNKASKSDFACAALPAPIESKAPLAGLNHSQKLTFSLLLTSSASSSVHCLTAIVS